MKSGDIFEINNIYFLAYDSVNIIEPYNKSNLNYMLIFYFILVESCFFII